jgi:hypothetical protein
VHGLISLCPRPEASNNGTTASQQLTKPGFSVSGGRYSTTDSGFDYRMLIRQLKSGTPPMEVNRRVNSLVFSTPISVNQTKTLKAKAFLTGFLPGETETQTYFINEHTFSLPVVSISTRPDYLYDNLIGIYVEGTNGVSGVYCNRTR